MKMILILTNKDDITVDFIIRELVNQNIQYYRLNTEDIPNDIDINFNVDKGKFLLHDKNKNIDINLQDIEAVYFRRAEINKFNYVTNISEQERNYLRSEMAFVLEGIYKVLRNKFWLNNIYNIRDAENKIYQLQLAQEVGFEIPASTISNQFFSVNQFVNKCNRDCIIKPIKTGNMKDITNPKVIFTSKLDSTMQDNIDRVEAFPLFIQKNIHKRYDLRCIVVDDEVFVAEIDSQNDRDSLIDWRRAKSYLEHREHLLPLQIKSMCIQMTKKLKLNYSAIDLILDENGNYIFLECNPNGQWAWLEKRLNFPISKKIVRILMEKRCKDENI